MTTKCLEGHRSKSIEALALYGKTSWGNSMLVFSVSTPSAIGRNQRKDVAGMSKLDLQKDEFSHAESSLDDKGMEHEDGSSGGPEVVPLVPKARAPTQMTMNDLSLESRSDSKSEYIRKTGAPEQAPVGAICGFVSITTPPVHVRTSLMCRHDLIRICLH